MFSSRIFFTLVILLFSITSIAQTKKEIVTQYNGWYMYFGNHRLTDKLGIHTEYQWRRNDWVKNWQQSVLRVGADVYLSKSTTISGGYGWIKSFPYGKQPIAYSFNEHRIWEQLIVTQQAGILYFQHRYRLEQRFLEQKKVNESGKFEYENYKYQNRVRYRLQATIPLTNKELKDNTLFAVLYDEVFLGFGKSIGLNILDQNRLYLALGWRFNNDFNIQMGYLNQYLIKTNAVNQECNHTLQMSVQYNIDFREK